MIINKKGEQNKREVMILMPIILITLKQNGTFLQEMKIMRCCE